MAMEQAIAKRRTIRTFMIVVEIEVKVLYLIKL